MSFSIVVATDEKGGIGKENKLLWNIPADLKRFKDITTKYQDDNINTVIMGTNTFKSIGKPLPNRNNIVIGNTFFLNGEFSKYDRFYTTNGNEALYYYKNINDIIEKYKDCDKEYFIIGGSSIYKQFLPYVNKIYLTEVKGDYNADTFFYYNKDEFEVFRNDIWREQNGYKFRFLKLKRKWLYE